jgi:site-specific DNA-methyltransferase (adenine-specific)
MDKLKTNVLYYGDNLEILRKREYFPDNSIDLIYLDPPFSSKKNYNLLFKESDYYSEAQIKAFSDTWHWGKVAEDTLQDIRLNAQLTISKLIEAMIDGIGRNDITAYLVMMTARLIELRRVLKPTGSLYLHCDPTASHYLKLILDQIFGAVNFQNEVIWYYCGAGVSPKRFGRRHDVIFFYTKSPNWAFYPNGVRTAYAGATIERFKHYIGNIRDGKDFGIQTLHPEGKHPDDVWEISIVAPSAKERLGYPTQKPLALVERIIKASSKEGDVVLDPFCGCGTAIVAAHKLNRRWIGIDITHLAIRVMRKRLNDTFPGIQEGVDYTIKGEPVDLASAKALSMQKPDGRYQFQYWALSRAGAQPLGEKKKGADKGIDGVISFIDGLPSKAQRAVVQVKSGHVHVKDIRELKDVASHNAMGIFITLEPPTREMSIEAVSAGYYHSTLYNKDYPKIQVITIEELLQGKTADMPPTRMEPFIKAPKIPKREGEQISMSEKGEVK